jgi:hypothetical protein
VTDFDALTRDLSALIAPGAAHGTTIKDTQRPSAAGAFDGPTPKGWEPGVQFREDGGWEVTTPATILNLTRDETAWTSFVEEQLGITLPEGYVAILAEAKFDPVAWTRDEHFLKYPDHEDREDGKKWTKAPALTKPVWRYKWRIELSSEQVHREDVDRIIAEVMRARFKRPKAAKPEVTRRALNVVYADPQAGKVALLGGTKELAERIATSFDLVKDHISDLKKVGRTPTEATWWDGGDCIEGFSNVKAQQQTNDLSLTQMVRAHRRFTMHGLDMLAREFSSVSAYTAGSNHARVRDGKDPVNRPDDDWGIEGLSSVQDAFALNEDAYGHVRFGYPHGWRDSLCADSGGLPIGLAHGHQFANGSDKAVKDWWKDQTFGEQPVAAARILVSGHFHTWASREMGNGRLWVQAPTLDNGSDWFTGIKGEVSKPGLLVFSSTEYGWDDLRILRAA